MAETAKEKTTREVAGIFARHHFTYMASVFIHTDDIDERTKTIARIKRIVKEENPDLYVFFFLTTHTEKATGEVQLYLTFFTWDSLVGVRLRKEQEHGCIAIAGESRSKPNRKRISQGFSIMKMQGWINKIRRDKVFDLRLFFGKAQVKRYGFLNAKKKPSDNQLASFKADYVERYGRALE